MVNTARRRRGGGLLRMRVQPHAVAAAAAALASALAALPASGQQIRGRVVDEETRRAVSGATVTLLTPDSTIVQQTGTDGNGFFSAAVRQAGRYVVTVARIGFADSRREIEIGNDTTLAAFVLKTAAVPIEPVEARAAARADTMAGFSRSRFILAGSKLRVLEQHAVPFKQAVLDLGGSLRMRESYVGGRYRICIEARRGFGSIRQVGCAWPAIIIDDIELRAEDMTMTVRSLQLSNMESMEYLPPVEAGRRYGLGASPNGAIVIWTRGRGPHLNPARDKQ